MAYSAGRAVERQVVVRNPGGAYSDKQKQYIYDPFTKETGIEVVIVASTLTKMLALVKAGSDELDVTLAPESLVI
jgi:putative spermidine/putrescine transport system substrate-binding protein